MDLKQLQQFQEDFDKKHGWENRVKGEMFFEKLKILTICLTGEIGEFANELKKLLRDKKAGIDTKRKRLPKLKEELIDIFIFLLKTSITLGVDLEKEYFEKMKKSEKRFKKFEKNKSKQD